MRKTLTIAGGYPFRTTSFSDRSNASIAEDDPNVPQSVRLLLKRVAR